MLSGLDEATAEKIQALKGKCIPPLGDEQVRYRDF
jgi:hypothetical protein